MLAGEQLFFGAAGGQRVQEHAGTSTPGLLHEYKLQVAGIDHSLLACCFLDSIFQGQGHWKRVMQAQAPSAACVLVEMVPIPLGRGDPSQVTLYCCACSPLLGTR